MALSVIDRSCNTNMESNFRSIQFKIDLLAGIVFLLALASPSFGVQPPKRPSPTPTPVYRPRTPIPVYQPKTAPSPTGTPVMKPPVYTWATAETLTSVTQVSDVRSEDLWYKDLQVLIEKYGIAGLTEGKKLLPYQNLAASAYRTISQSALVQLRQQASKIGIPNKRFDELFLTNCPEPRAIDEILRSEDVINSLKCIFGPPTLKAIYPNEPMRRGYFVQVLEDAVANGALRISANSRMEMGPTKQVVNPAEIKELIEQGQRLINAKDYDGAIRMFNQVLDYEREYVDAYRFRGLAALLKYDSGVREGQLLYTAMFNFDDVIKRDSTSSDDYYLRGMTHVRLGSKEKAVADFRSGLRLDPNHRGCMDELKKLGVTP